MFQKVRRSKRIMNNKRKRSCDPDWNPLQNEHDYDDKFIASSSSSTTAISIGSSTPDTEVSDSDYDQMKTKRTINNNKNRVLSDEDYDFNCVKSNLTGNQSKNGEICDMNDFREARKTMIALSNKRICESVISELNEWAKKFESFSQDVHTKLKYLVSLSLDFVFEESKISKIIDNKNQLQEISMGLIKNKNLIKQISTQSFETEIDCPLLVDTVQMKDANELTRKIFDRQKLAEKIDRVKKNENLLNYHKLTNPLVVIDRKKLEEELQTFDTDIIDFTNSLKLTSNSFTVENSI